MCIIVHNFYSVNVLDANIIASINIISLFIFSSDIDEIFEIFSTILLVFESYFDSQKFCSSSIPLT